MKSVNSILIFIVFLFAGCAKVIMSDHIPSCVNSSIQTMKENNYHGTVTEYRYNNAALFFVRYNMCCDFQNTLYDESCNVGGAEGGIGGNIHTIPDSVLNKLTNPEIIFSN